MTRIIRPEFDFGREFTTVKPFTLAGIPFVPNQAFDKSLVSLRLLRQLYENRSLRFSEDQDEFVTRAFKVSTLVRPAKVTKTERIRIARRAIRKVRAA